jgi:GNAT superfamily N-acetyltransferase
VTPSVRAMTLDDIVSVREVELAAGVLFRTVGDPRIARCADDDPFTADELTTYVRAGNGWIATAGDRVIGFVVVDLVDGCAHVEEVAVTPAHGGRGVGTALIDHVARWAASRALPAVTLTTFRDVAWNRPWYERIGFRVVRDDELSPGLRDLRDAEDAHGLPAELRVVMRRDVVPQTSS